MLSRFDFFITDSSTIFFSGGGGAVFPIDETRFSKIK